MDVLGAQENVPIAFILASFIYAQKETWNSPKYESGNVGIAQTLLMPLPYCHNLY